MPVGYKDLYTKMTFTEYFWLLSNKDKKNQKKKSLQQSTHSLTIFTQNITYVETIMYMKNCNNLNQSLQK